MEFFINFFSEVLLFLNEALGGAGLALIAFTIIIRLLLLPLTLPSIKSSQKIKKLQPELKKIKEKYKDDKQGYALAQAQLYKSYNINPLAGNSCIRLPDKTYSSPVNNWTAAKPKRLNSPHRGYRLALIHNKLIS